MVVCMQPSSPAYSRMPCHTLPGPLSPACCCLPVTAASCTSHPDNSSTKLSRAGLSQCIVLSVLCMMRLPEACYDHMSCSTADMLACVAAATSPKYSPTSPQYSRTHPGTWNAAADASFVLVNAQICTSSICSIQAGLLGCDPRSIACVRTCSEVTHDRLSEAAMGVLQRQVPSTVHPHRSIHVSLSAPATWLPPPLLLCSASCCAGAAG